MTIHDIVKWTASAAIMTSAVLVSFKIEWAVVAWSFYGFILGHLIWSVYAYKMREYALLALNAGFIFIDTWAIYIRL